jgi:hypothetical protein
MRRVCIQGVSGCFHDAAARPLTNDFKILGEYAEKIEN